MARDCRFAQFSGWASGYFACSVSPAERPRVIDYIKNQEEHHLRHQLNDEVKILYAAADIPFDPRDLQ